MATCYICLDESATDDLLVDVCACKGTAVHTDCLIKWIERSATPLCSVCKQPIAGATRVEETGDASVPPTVVVLAVFALVAFPVYFASAMLADAVRDECVGCAIGSAVLLAYELSLAILAISIAVQPPRPRRRIDTEELRDRALRV
jgi:hypothetical protein